MNETLRQAQNNLEELFDIFNNRFYNGELERPIISIQKDSKNNCYGWCTTYKAWSTTDNNEFYEINICAEYLNRTLQETCSTLLHEMAHLYNITKGIRDCSNSQKHNLKFKEAAEAHGLVVEKTNKGWSKTSLNPETEEFVKTLTYEFKISRKPQPKKVKRMRKPTYKYYCPGCGAKVTSRQPLSVMCMECNEEMV